MSIGTKLNIKTLTLMWLVAGNDGTMWWQGGATTPPIFFGIFLYIFIYFLKLYLYIIYIKFILWKLIIKDKIKKI